MITVVLAVVLPSLGCLAAGLAAGRAWGRAGAENAWADGYNDAVRDEVAARGPDPGLDWDQPAARAIEQGKRVIEPADDEGPLVPLPDRLPDADTLTRMYATLGGDTELPPAGVASSETLGPRPGEPATVWDSDAPAERVPTIAELAEDAEYRLCWAELGAMRDSARAWYAETFSTGTLPAVR